MNETYKCNRCGAPLPADSPEGLCPRCLMALNLATQTDIPGEPGAAKPPPAPPLPVTDVAKLFPQLEILECLGRGGMGAVYKARQPRLDRIVALKILSPEKQGNQMFAERFEREARALAKLHHPNIVTVYDFGEVQGNFYLLMEFVDGLTLRQLLQSRKLAPPEALAIVPKICEALQYAHEQGIVHRDIKPENILMDKNGHVKIADFGIAKILGDGERTNLTEEQSIGTPHYMSPEQIEKPQLVDHRADIYSLGVVFYEMLTGELPLGKFQPPSKKVHIDVRLDEIVLRALEKEPERRYQQASEVKTCVEAVAATPGGSRSDEAQTNKSGIVRFVEMFFNMTFQSRLAIKVCGFSALGFLGFLGLFGLFPGNAKWFALFSFMGFFGLIGVAFIIELFTRGKTGWRPSALHDSFSKNLVQFVVLGVALLFACLVVLLAMSSPSIGANTWGVFRLGFEILTGAALLAFLSVLYRAITVNSPDAWRAVKSWLPMLILMVLGIAFGFWSHHFLKHASIKFDYIGQTWFPYGDSILITSIERTEDQMTVKGHYNLVSHDTASLTLYLTSTNSTGFPEGTNQSINISKGSGDFELVHRHLVVGLPHVSMYAGNNAIASVYFGNKEEAAEESQASWITNSPTASSKPQANELAKPRASQVKQSHEEQAFAERIKELEQQLYEAKTNLTKLSASHGEQSREARALGALIIKLEQQLYEAQAYVAELRASQGRQSAETDAQIEVQQMRVDELDRQLLVTIQALKSASDNTNHPQVISVWPPNGATDLDRQQVIRIRFDQPMNPGDLEISWRSGGFLTYGQPDYDFAHNEFSIAVQLLPGTTNEIQVGTPGWYGDGFRTPNVVFADSTNWQFTTSPLSATDNSVTPEVVQISPGPGETMPVLTLLKVKFDQPMTLADGLPHLEGGSAVDLPCTIADFSCDSSNQCVTVPLVLPPDNETKLKLYGFHSADGAAGAPVVVRCEIGTNNYSSSQRDEISSAAKDPRLKDLLSSMKAARKRLVSGIETIEQTSLSQEKGAFDRLTIQPAVFKWQGTNQFYEDISDIMNTKAFILGTDGKNCWMYSDDNREGARVDSSPVASVEEIYTSVADPFALTRLSVQSAIAKGRLVYEGQTQLDGHPCYRISSWQVRQTGNEVLPVMAGKTEWWIDSETLLPVQLINNSMSYRSILKFHFDNLNQSLPDSVFQPPGEGKTDDWYDAKLGPDEKRFLTIKDGSSDGQISGRIGRRGPNGSTNSGLN